MKGRAQVALLDDGRLHLNDGPIDLIVFVDDAEWLRKPAFEVAINRFSTILDELCEELSYLRAPSDDGRSLPKGLAYLIPFANKEKEWTAVQLKEFNYDMLAQLSRQAAVVFNEPKYLKTYQKFYASDQSSDRSILQYGLVVF